MEKPFCTLSDPHLNRITRTECAYNWRIWSCLLGYITHHGKNKCYLLAKHKYCINISCYIGNIWGQMGEIKGNLWTQGHRNLWTQRKSSFLPHPKLQFILARHKVVYALTQLNIFLFWWEVLALFHHAIYHHLKIRK